MAIQITSDCIGCGACEPVCPNGAISQKLASYRIDSERCTECVGFARTETCQSVCPVECCLPDPDHLEPEEVLIQRALTLHSDDDMLRAKVASNAFPSKFRK